MKILNLGLGKPRHYFPDKNVVNVDIWKPYLIGYKGRNILADVRCLPIREKSFDAVVCIEMIEHLRFEEGITLIKNMERIAKHLVFLSTPTKFFVSEMLDGNIHQLHKSYLAPNVPILSDYNLKRINNTNILYKYIGSNLYECVSCRVFVQRLFREVDWS